MVKIVKNLIIVFLLGAFILLPAGKVYPQNTIEILDAETHQRNVEIKVGEILDVEIWVTFIDVQAIAVYAYLTFDGNIFEVLDTDPATELIQPFNSSGSALPNFLTNLYGNGNGIPFEQIDLGANRVTGGSPVTGRVYIGKFRLKAINKAVDTKIYIDDDPGNLRTTSYRTSEGITKRFGRGPRISSQDEGLAMTVNVTGIGLEDIPDVYFQPGETNDKINLDNYVINSTGSKGSLQWQYSGNTNVLVSVNQDSPRNVIFSSVAGWTGKETITFKVTDPFGFDAEDNVAVTVGYSPQITGLDLITFEEDTYYDIFLSDFVNDPDDSADQITWEVRIDSGAINTEYFSAAKLLTVTAEPNWFGTGFMMLYAYDKNGIPDSQLVRVDVTPLNDPPILGDIPDVKVPYNGSDNSIILDNYVTDVDNQKSELTWDYNTSQNLLIDILTQQQNRLIITPDSGYLGIDTIVFKVFDPLNFWQADTVIVTVERFPPEFIKVLPDTVIFPEDVLRIFYIDLKEYIEDPDNDIGELQISAEGSIGEILIEIDEDLNSYIKIPSLSYSGTDNIEFTVQDPQGNTSYDIAEITILSGEYPKIGNIPDIYMEMGGADSSIILDNYIYDKKTSKSQMTWTYQGNDKIEIYINPENRKITFSSPDQLFVGSEIITLRATDTDGYYDEKTIKVSVYPNDGTPIILGLPDINITKNVNKTINLNNYVFVWPEASKSVLVWSFSGSESKVDVSVNNNTKEATFKVADPDFKGIQTFTFTCTNPDSQKNDSDDLNVIVTFGKPPILGRIPDITFLSGQRDSSIFLNRYIVDFDTPLDSISWAVKRNTNILYDSLSLLPGEDHRLRLSNKPGFVGIEELTLEAMDPEGNVTKDTINVQVLSPASIDIALIPNPVDANFIDIVVLSTDSLFGNPNLRIKFNSTDDLITTGRIPGVLMWKGDYIFPRGKSGLAKIFAYAVDSYGTSHTDSMDLSIGVVFKNSAFYMKNDRVSVSLKENTFDEDRTIAIIEENIYNTFGQLDCLSGFTDVENLFEISPSRIKSIKKINLNVDVISKGKVGLFRYFKENDTYEFVKSRISNKNIFAEISDLGTYFVAVDETPPVAKIEKIKIDDGLKLYFDWSDNASGIDKNSLKLYINGSEYKGRYNIIHDYIKFEELLDFRTGLNEISMKIADNVGNWSETAVEKFSLEEPLLPGEFKLYQNYPNPFNPETEIKFDLPRSAKTRLDIFSITGQLVRRLYDGELNAGSFKFKWDGCNNMGVKAASGVYIYLIRTPYFESSKKMTLLK